MTINDRIAQLAAKVKKQKNFLNTEEATKTALVLPFIQLLGYEVFNPAEVVPEFIADHGVKKGEKVDYAILQHGQPMLLIECKKVGAELNARHASQLFRYFSATDAKFGILTDGCRYLFFSDLDKRNKMDDRPFFEFDLLDFNEEQCNELSRFSKERFDLDSIMLTASDLKYHRALIAEIKKEFFNPSEDLTKLLASRVFDGRLNASMREKFSELLVRALRDFLRAEINNRLESAIDAGEHNGVAQILEERPADDIDASIVTTEEELSSLRIIQAISAEVVEPSLISMKDMASYCAIVFAESARKTIARLYYGKRRMSLGLILNGSEIRHEIKNVMDLYNYKEQVMESVLQYVDSGKPAESQFPSGQEIQQSDEASQGEGEALQELT